MAGADGLNFKLENNEKKRLSLEIMDEVVKKLKSSTTNEANEEMSGPRFPTELWLMIFGYLDWKTLQKKATLVCNSWLEMIRKCPKLSGEVRLRSDKIEKEDIVAILSRWEQLKVLHAINGFNFHFKVQYS